MLKRDDTRLWAQEWWESERGWGQRPDGFTLHLTKQAALDHIKTVVGGRKYDNPVPDEYDFTVGEPFEVSAAVLDLTAKDYERLEKTGTIWIRKVNR